MLTSHERGSIAGYEKNAQTPLDKFWNKFIEPQPTDRRIVFYLKLLICVPLALLNVPIFAFLLLAVPALAIFHGEQFLRSRDVWLVIPSISFIILALGGQSLSTGSWLSRAAYWLLAALAGGGYIFTLVVLIRIFVVGGD